MSVWSQEAATAGYRPILTVTYETPATPTPTPTSSNEGTVMEGVKVDGVKIN